MFPFRHIWANLVFLSSILVLLIVGAFFLIVVDLEERSLSQVKEFSSENISRTMRENWESEALDLANLLARQCAPHLSRFNVSAMQEILTEAVSCRDVLYINLHNADGRILIDTTEGSILIGEKPTRSFARRAVEVRRALVQEGLDFIETAVPIFLGSEKLGTLRVAYSKASIAGETERVVAEINERIDRSIDNSIANTLLLGATALILSIVVGAVFARRLAHPLNRLAEGTKKIAAGDLTYRTDIRSRDEIGQLAESFNKMTADLERATVSKNYVDNIIRTMIGGLIISSPKGAITFVNQAALDMLGYDEEKLMNLPVTAILAEDTSTSSETLLDKLKKTGRIRNLEGYLRTRDNRKVPVLLSGSVMEGRDRESEGIVFVALDISERKEIEEKIQGYVKRLEYSGHLRRLYTDILSHDLLNPANIITHMTAFLIKKNPDADREEMAMILRNSEKLTQIIRDASDYARVESGESLEREKIDLFALLASVIDRLRPQFEERKMEVRFDRTGEAPIEANSMIEDIFSNILTNTLKYAPEESGITVTIVDEGQNWLTTVADEGEGIADAYKESVFERFERRDKLGVKGTGLGLAIAHRLVALHGGRIWVEDAEGGGCLFKVRLPQA